jgi:putative intracellular protease/amidase
MKRHIVTALFSLLFSSFAVADTFEGHLLPTKCRDENPVDHTRACALACKTTGFGLLTASGEYLSFDAAGNQKAIALLEASDKAADLRVKVEGVRKGKALAVSSITMAGESAPASAAATAAREGVVEKALDDSATTSRDETRSVAILLFEGVQTIDYTGPYEVFSDAFWRGERAFRIFTVSEKSGAIHTAAGMTVTPDYTLADAPRADIVVLPGGGVAASLERPAVIAWIKKATAQSRIVLSVCNGAYFLAKAGLLDGLEATTTAGNLATLQRMAPRAHVVADKRVTDNGKIIMTGGLSAGIDGALHIVRRETNEVMARGLALYLEYDWKDDASFLPATLAFRQATPLMVTTLFPLGAEITEYQGDEARWIVRATANTDRGAPAVMSMIDGAARSLGGSAAGPGCYLFKDYDATEWTTCTRVESISDKLLSIALETNRSSKVAAR